MKQERLTGCNVNELKAKITLNTRMKKPNFTKDLVRAGLLRYFDGNEDRVDHVMDVIMSTADPVEADTVSLKIN